MSTQNDMKEAKRVLVIACGVLARDINHLARRLDLGLESLYLPGGLHENPDKLRCRLQSAVDRASEAGQWERIVVAYGICGRGTVGLKARRLPLMMPRVHDCIALILGGESQYREQFERFPGTYYISQGWLAEKGHQQADGRRHAWMGDTKVYFDQLVQKYGRDQAEHTFAFLNSWRSNYQRAVFLDTRVGDGNKAEAFARQMAERHGWIYEKIEGSTRLLSQLLQARQASDAILLVPPNHVTVYDAMRNGLMASPLSTDLEQHLPPRPRIEVFTQATAATQRCRLKVGVGIDAGGTYTDAVLYDFEAAQVRCKHKALTTKWDFTVGIRQALQGLDARQLPSVQMAAVSTTLATNALVEGDGQKVGLLLMPPPGVTSDPDVVHEPQALLDGRLDITGQPLEPIDEAQVRRVARHMANRQGVRAFAVSGYAGSINPEHEICVKQLLREETGLFVSCGHELSQLLDFKVRAETAVHNARIVPRLVRLLEDVDRILKEFNITAPMMIVRGDGALMTTQMALQRPVETILSGPAASVAGARFLTRIQDAVVIDMGGTTTDIAALKNGTVRVSARGSQVAKARTHVKALDIHTTGLGGDSLIEYHHGVFTIGPRRVAPVAWLGDRSAGWQEALAYLSARRQHLQGSSRKVQLLALTGAVKALALSDAERKILAMLRSRPHSLDELVELTGVLHSGGLPLARLEEQFIIQRCGLTPTDLLHAAGRFERWNAAASRGICRLVAELAGMAPEELVAAIHTMIVQRLAKEVMHHQLVQSGNTTGEPACPTCRQLFDHMLGSRGANYSVRFQLDRPIIGVGAPVHHFLPQAANMLGTQAILPPDTDVANAIGAISSKVVVQRQVAIKPDSAGGFYVEGIAGGRHFKQLETAERFAKKALVAAVRKMAAIAGTSQSAVQVHSHDRTVPTAHGDQIFLERQLAAELSGLPDLALCSAKSDPKASLALAPLRQRAG